MNQAADSFFQEGVIALRDGRIAESETSYRQALKKEKGYRIAARAPINLLMARRAFTEAITVSFDILKHRPTDQVFKLKPAK